MGEDVIKCSSFKSFLREPNGNVRYIFVRTDRINSKDKSWSTNMWVGVLPGQSRDVTGMKMLKVTTVAVSDAVTARIGPPMSGRSCYIPHKRRRRHGITPTTGASHVTSLVLNTGA